MAKGLLISTLGFHKLVFVDAAIEAEQVWNLVLLLLQQLQNETKQPGDFLGIVLSSTNSLWTLKQTAQQRRSRIIDHGSQAQKHCDLEQ